MFTLDRPTCVGNLLSAFQIVRGLSAPAGRCSSTVMLLSTLASRVSSRSLHNFMREAFSVMLMGLVHLMKLFRDFGRGTTPKCQLSGCLSSVVCRVRSVRLATVLLVIGGAIPASMGRLLVFVGFRQSVIIRQDWFLSVSRSVSLHGWGAPTLVQAFCNLTSHKLQQKQFHLFHTPDSILYGIKKVLGKYPGVSPEIVESPRSHQYALLNVKGGYVLM